MEQESYDVEYTSEILKPESEDVASSPTSTFKVETNRAYNEAEKFISEIEKENEAFQKASNASQESVQISELSNIEDGGKTDKKNPSTEVELMPADSKSKKIIPSKRNSSKKNSTVSYSLVNRSALFLPNPVYTCASSGKIVINIVVSETGKIIDAQYNTSASTSSNECLIDAAIDYAKNTNFTTFAGKKEQLGSITYNFPGQQ